MMSLLEPRGGIRVRQDAIPHIPTEIALRWLDEAPTFKLDQSLTKETEARILGLKKSFLSSDTKSRTSLLVQLARKESEIKTGLDAEEREGEYAFPEGAVLTGGLIRALPAAEAQRAFWDVLATLGSDDREGERNRKMSSGTTPANVVYDFVEHARESFPTDDWGDIGTGLLNAYGRDTRISEKAREYAIRSYFDHSFGKDINDVILKAQNRAVRGTTSYLREHDVAIDQLLELQPIITGLILDKHLGNSLRAQMLRYAPFRICPENVQGEIAKLAYMRGTSEELSRGVIDWLKFPQSHYVEAVDAYDVLEKVVQKRKETPSLQLYGMVVSLNRDSQFPPRSGTRSNIAKFTKALDEIWKTNPHGAQPESRAYELLAKNADGRRYIKEKMIGSDNAMKRIAGVDAALRGDPSKLLDQNITRKCVNDIIAELKEVKSRSFCYTVVQRLCDAGSFLPKDVPLLRNLKDTLNTFHDERASTTAMAVDGMLRSLPKFELRVVR